VEDKHLYPFKRPVKSKNIYEANAEFFIPNDNVKLSDIEKPDRIIQAKLKVFKLMTMIYLNVIQRTTHKEFFIPIYLDLLKSYMNSHIPASMWFLT